MDTVPPLPKEVLMKTKRSKVFDLSGAAATDVMALDENEDCYIDKVTAIYEEASSADAGIAMKIGTVLADGTTDDDSIATYTSEVSKAINRQFPVTLLTTLQSNQDGGPTNRPCVPKGASVTFASAGGKTGTGNVIFEVSYFQRQQPRPYG